MSKQRKAHPSTRARRVLIRRDCERDVPRPGRESLHAKTQALPPVTPMVMQGMQGVACVLMIDTSAPSSLSVASLSAVSVSSCSFELGCASVCAVCPHRSLLALDLSQMLPTISIAAVAALWPFGWTGTLSLITVAALTAWVLWECVDRVRVAPVLLRDFVTFRPPEKNRVSRADFCRMQRKMGCFTPDSLAFLEKMIERTGTHSARIAQSTAHNSADPVVSSPPPFSSSRLLPCRRARRTRRCHLLARWPTARAARSRPSVRTRRGLSRTRTDTTAWERLCVCTERPLSVPFAAPHSLSCRSHRCCFNVWRICCRGRVRTRAPSTFSS
jgi:hypothetical protein